MPEDRKQEEREPESAGEHGQTGVGLDVEGTLPREDVSLAAWAPSLAFKRDGVHG